MSTHDDFREDPIEAPDPEPELAIESDGTMTLTGSSVHGYTGGGYASGGMITSPPFAPTPSYPTYPSTGTFPSTTTTTHPTSTTPAKTLGTVTLPPKFTEKVLVAFMEGEDDDVVWAKKLRAEDIQIGSDRQIILTLRLEDFYDNED